jgi:transglutaminase-like putative cysteine protease
MKTVVIIIAVVIALFVIIGRIDFYPTPETARTAGNIAVPTKTMPPTTAYIPIASPTPVYYPTPTIEASLTAPSVPTPAFSPIIAPTFIPSATSATSFISDAKSSPILPPTTVTSSLAQLSKVMENPSSAIKSMDYKWKYGLDEWTWSLQIPQAIYDYYKAIPRSPTANYSVYVTHPLDDEYITKVVNKLQQNVKEAGYDEFETVSFVAAFVQSLEYTSDLVTEGFDEYPRYPIETLVDKGGDCEDTAILTASLIRAMGYGVVLITFSDHVAVGVAGEDSLPGTYWEYGGKKYFYLETTGNGWGIGEVPDQYKNAKAKVYPMVPVPILTHDWDVKANGSYIQIHVTVDNLGSAEAKGVYVFVGFDAGNDQVWNKKVSATFDLGVNESEVATLNLIPPVDKHTRIVVQIVYDGYAVDDSYSKWFDS